MPREAPQPIWWSELKAGTRRNLHLLRVVGNVFRSPDVLFTHDASVVDNVGRGSAGTTQGVERQHILVQDGNGDGVFDGRHSLETNNYVLA